MMTHFFKYRLSTGRIEQTGTCLMSEIELQHNPDGCALVLGKAEPGQYYLNDMVQTIVTPEEEWTTVRSERDRRLARSDWTQLPDVPLATKEAWASYRQALRDITLQPDPFHIVWPQAQI